MFCIYLYSVSVMYKSRLDQHKDMWSTHFILESKTAPRKFMVDFEKIILPLILIGLGQCPFCGTDNIVQ